MAEEQNIICGALELHRKTAKEVMTPLDDIYMLNIESCLDFNTINEIMKQGYSRIPVYENERTNVVSVLFIKDLAFIDPDDNTPLRTVSNYYQNPLNFIFEDTTLDSIFKEFKEGNKGHMALVQRINNEGDCDPFYEVVGLVTLEDVIEELIQEEIVDETDVVMDNKSKRRRTKAGRRDFTEFSSNTQTTGPRKLQVSPQLQVACYQYLRTTLEPFKEEMLSESILKRLVTQDIIHCIKVKDPPVKTDPSTFIYTQGKAVDYFVLILEGHVEVVIGKENLTFESGPFTYFGNAALCTLPNVGESSSACTQLSRSSGMLAASVQSLDTTKFSFTPDYSVRAITEVIFMKLRRSQYVAARRAFLLEKSQKEGITVDQFDSEMATILSEYDHLASPVWENTSLATPGSKEFVVNGMAIPADGKPDNLDLTLSDRPTLARQSTRKSRGEFGSMRRRQGATPPGDLVRSSPGSPMVPKPPRVGGSVIMVGSSAAAGGESSTGVGSNAVDGRGRLNSASTFDGSNMDTEEGAASLRTSPSAASSQFSPLAKDNLREDASNQGSPGPQTPRSDDNKNRLSKHESIS
ncbi:Cyclic nucleotide-binding-like [Trinorchestia longiramus]|nr:Cyclic nucleotide-binding-like [Trinorchestia longiramus]